MTRFLLGLVAACLFSTIAAAQNKSPLTITAYPIASFTPRSETTRFGSLQFLSGLELRGSDPRFGGISGLSVSRDGTNFLALTDKGSFLKGRFVEVNGRLTGIENAVIESALAPGGRTVQQARTTDLESLAVSGGKAYVGVERANAVFSFTLGDDGLPGAATRMSVPPGVGKLPSNRGLEGLALVPSNGPSAGALLAVAERSTEKGETTAGFLIGGKKPGTLSVARHDDFDVTDLAFLPGGDLLILERWYSGIRGVAFRIRRIAGRTIVPGAVLDGPVLIEAGMESQIDNMEALAVHQDSTGRTILTLMSDDNFSFFQRTLVLRFALVEDTPG